MIGGISLGLKNNKRLSGPPMLSLSLSVFNLPWHSESHFSNSNPKKNVVVCLKKYSTYLFFKCFSYKQGLIRMYNVKISIKIINITLILVMRIKIDAFELRFQTFMKKIHFFFKKKLWQNRKYAFKQKKGILLIMAQKCSWRKYLEAVYGLGARDKGVAILTKPLLLASLRLQLRYLRQWRYSF